MKKIFKKEVIIAFIVGIILASSIAVYATINAKDVDYKDGKTVEYALNDLYEKYNKFDTLTLSLKTHDYSTSMATSSYAINDSIKEKYSHFKFINVQENNSVSNSQLRGKNTVSNSNVTLTENTEYNTSDFSYIWVNINGNDAILSYDLFLYN